MDQVYKVSLHIKQWYQYKFMVVNVCYLCFRASMIFDPFYDMLQTRKKKVTQAVYSQQEYDTVMMQYIKNIDLPLGRGPDATPPNNTPVYPKEGKDHSIHQSMSKYCCNTWLTFVYRFLF